MRRRWGWLAVLLAVVVTGCGTGQRDGTEDLSEELAEVRADRDRLATLAKQLSSTSAVLEAYAVNDRQACLATLRAARRRVDQARAALRRGTPGGNAAELLGSASEELEEALRGPCAPPTR